MQKVYSLSSPGQYLVFDSSDLSVETLELFCINGLMCFGSDVVVRIYPTLKSIFFGLSLLSAEDRVW